MIRAYYLYTGPDGNSYVDVGQLDPKHVVPATSVQFKEDPPHSALDWHNDPTPQYVLFLQGALEFKLKSGLTFVVRPGEVLIATDHTGTGHSWRLINDQPWVRAYVVFKPEVNLHFIKD